MRECNHTSLAGFVLHLRNETQLRFVPMPSVQPRKRPTHCTWCGREMAPNPSGRHRKYCSQACRQRSYEQRHQLKGTTIPEDSVIMSAANAAKMHDQLFELRCAAEDVQTALREGEDKETLDVLVEELVMLARGVEKIRGQ